ncbi:MAG: DUF2442 domain-containing protein [Cyclobacteriaceae bacterium]|nr:DUF2442 domain-containing protein [Cyclobacteriaceae bacterium HetDA_MAG_MS6]
MKPSISSKTKTYLEHLKQKEDQPDFYHHQMDSIDQLVYKTGLRIKHLFFDLDLDVMVVLLNNRKIIKRGISEFAGLKGASLNQLENYENDGTGIHWPDLDEDLSLRGFLQYELTQVDTPLMV